MNQAEEITRASWAHCLSRAAWLPAGRMATVCSTWPIRFTSGAWTPITLIFIMGLPLPIPVSGAATAVSHEAVPGDIRSSSHPALREARSRRAFATPISDFVGCVSCNDLRSSSGCSLLEQVGRFYPSETHSRDFLHRYAAKVELGRALDLFALPQVSALRRERSHGS